MNKIDAYKMDGLGNDFIIFDQRKDSLSLTKNQIIKIADRSFFGCDQVIFIDKDQTLAWLIPIVIILTFSITIKL